jgi:hypothetical protein
VSHNGEHTCDQHPTAASCELCRRPTDVMGAGWTSLGAGRARCPTCGRRGIDTAADADRYLPRVRDGIAALGFALGRRVRVRLVGAGELSSVLAERGATAFGATRIWVDGGGGIDVVDVMVLRGLTPAWFGRTIVHENVHAWLAEQGIRVRLLPVEEGFCELAAHRWLSQGSTAMARALVRGIEQAPDPVYGDGFRAVRAAVELHGLAAVIARLRATGGLPDP